MAFGGGGRHQVVLVLKSWFSEFVIGVDSLKSTGMVEWSVGNPIGSTSRTTTGNKGRTQYGDVKACCGAADPSLC